MGHHNDHLSSIVKQLPADYEPWGDEIRWADPERAYPDCSQGCIFFYPLKGKPREPLGMDWGVCSNPHSHRCGLLTFEHQGCLNAVTEQKEG